MNEYQRRMVFAGLGLLGSISLHIALNAPVNFSEDRTPVKVALNFSKSAVVSAENGGSTASVKKESTQSAQTKPVIEKTSQNQKAKVDSIKAEKSNVKKIPKASSNPMHIEKPLSDGDVSPVSSGQTFGSGLDSLEAAKAYKESQGLFSSDAAASAVVDTNDVPPKPGDNPVDEAVYDDKPYGNVLVLKVLIDEHGKALDADIEIPSKEPLKDLAIIFTAKDAVFNKVNPPLMPGETRWLHIRYPYADNVKKDQESVLP